MNCIETIHPQLSKLWIVISICKPCKNYKSSICLLFEKLCMGCMGELITHVVIALKLCLLLVENLNHNQQSTGQYSSPAEAGSHKAINSSVFIIWHKHKVIILALPVSQSTLRLYFLNEINNIY